MSEGVSEEVSEGVSGRGSEWVSESVTHHCADCSLEDAT